jgi:hypothetical protein
MGHNSELHLWRAVVGQAMEDATGSVDRPRSTKPLTPQQRREFETRRRVAVLERSRARDWLLHGGKDFQLVCHLAQLDPDAVRDKAQKMASKGWSPVGIKRRRIAETIEAV